MVADVVQCGELGCDGVVLGILKADGSVDVDRCAELVAHAGSMQVTFHRAFDRVRNPLTALEDVIGLGCSRSSPAGCSPTSNGEGDAANVGAGRGDGVTIMPGSGVRSTNIVELALFTGARAFHSSARTTRRSAMAFINPAMAEELTSVTIDTDEVARLRSLLDDVSRSR